MPRLALFVVLATACTYERSGSSQLREQVRAEAGACPDGHVMLDALTRDWAGPGFEADGDVCHTEEILDAELIRTGDGTGCCYPVSCNAALLPEQEVDLYYSACVHLSCDHINYSVFSAQRARERLVEYGLPCTVTSDTATTHPDISCDYRTEERWSCSREGG